MKRKLTTFLLLLVTTTIFAQYPTNGLVAYYPFTGNANDMSGNGYNGTNNYATLTTDRFGNPNAAYFFNGSSSYISIPTTPFLLQDYSYSVWAFPMANPAVEDKMMVICIGGSGGDQHITFANLYNPIIALGWAFANYNVSSSYNWWSQSSLPQLNIWYHIVVTRESSFYKIYINDVLVNSQVPNGVIPDYSSTPFATIGKRSQPSITQFFNGKIDDIGFYNRALTQLEVDTLFYANYIGINENSNNSTNINPNTFVFDNTLTISTSLFINSKNINLRISNLLGQTLYNKV